MSTHVFIKSLLVRKAICGIGVMNLEIQGIFLKRCIIKVSGEPNFFAKLQILEMCKKDEF